MPRVVFKERHVEKPHARRRTVFAPDREYLVSGAVAQAVIAAGKASPAPAKRGDAEEPAGEVAPARKSGNDKGGKDKASRAGG
jgi:hypothetical protein